MCSASLGVVSRDVISNEAWAVIGPLFPVARVRKMLARFADGFRVAFTIPCEGAVLAPGRAVPGAG